METSKVTEIIGRNQFFQGLAPGVIKTVATNGSLKELDTDAILYSQGEAASSASVVLAGEISLRKNRLEVERKQPPDLFGEVAVWDGGARFVEAVASTKATVLELPSDLLTNLLSEPGFAQRMLHQVVTAARLNSGSPDRHDN